jgi:sugar phosphate permease
VRPRRERLAVRRAEHEGYLHDAHRFQVCRRSTPDRRPVPAGQRFRPTPVDSLWLELRSDPLRRRWVIWTALAVAFLLVNVHRLSNAVLSEDLMRAFDTTGAGLGALHSAFFYVYAVLQVGAGVVADRFGVRRTATAGTVLMSLGGLWFGVADTFAAAFLARLCVGLGASVIYIATLRFCTNWFRQDEFATMNGPVKAVRVPLAEG